MTFYDLRSEEEPCLLSNTEQNAAPSKLGEVDELSNKNKWLHTGDLDTINLFRGVCSYFESHKTLQLFYQTEQM